MSFNDILKQANRTYAIKRPTKKEAHELAQELTELCQSRDAAGQQIDPAELVESCAALMAYFAPSIPKRTKTPWAVLARLTKNLPKGEPRDWMRLIYVRAGMAYATDGKIALRTATDLPRGSYTHMGTECESVDGFEPDHVVGMIDRAAAWTEYTGDRVELTSVAALRIEYARDYANEITPLGIESDDARAFDAALVRNILRDPAKPFTVSHHPDRQDGRALIRQGEIEGVLMPFTHSPFNELV